MIQVMCVVSELQEDGDVISVGERGERLGEQESRRYYGNELDGVSWHFEQYAPLRAASPWLIAGTVTSIHAIYASDSSVAVDREASTTRSKIVHVEKISTTRETRDPEYGGEQLTGWLFPLSDEQFRAADPWPI